MRKRLLRSMQKIKEIIKNILSFVFRNGILIRIGDQNYKFDARFIGYNNFKRDDLMFKRWLDECRKAKMIFDVGAHIGLYTIPAHKVNPDATVVAIEPGWVNTEYLHKNLRYNDIDKNVWTARYTFGEKNETFKPFYQNNKPSPLNSLVPISGFRKGTVHQWMLDRDAKAGIPDLVKIDVEGAEFGVLKGAKQTMLNHKPTIFLSVHPKLMEKLGESVAEMTKYIRKDLKYEIYDENDIKIIGILRHKEYILKGEI